VSGIVDHLLSTPAWLTLLVIFAVPALEASAFLGFVFPGETVLILGGVVASQGRVPVAAVLAVGIGGAIIGDAVGYLVGRRWGRVILDSVLGRFVKAEHLDRAETALADRGGWTVFVGRFTAALRVLIPGLAGMGGMPYRRFAAFNIAGAVLWGGLMVLAGYLAGNSWHTIGHLISGAGLALLAVAVVAFVIFRIVRRRRRRQAQRHHDRESISSG
jgi:membrane-associated protein